MTKNRRRKAAPVPRGRRTAPRPAPCGPVSPGGASGPSGPALMPMLNCAYQTPLNQRDTPSSKQSPLGSVSAFGENCACSLWPPLPTKPEGRLCGGP